MALAAMRLVAALAATWPWGIAAADQSAGAPNQPRGGSGHLRARRLHGDHGEHGENGTHTHEGMTHEDFHVDGAVPPAPEGESPHGQWFPGPTVGNREWREANCSAHFYPTFAAATHACFEMHGTACTGFHDIGCDGHGWRYCTGHLMDMALESGPPGAVACTMVPYDLVRPEGVSTTLSANRYEPGPNVSNHAFRAGDCGPAYISAKDSAVEFCLLTGCTAIHDMNCDGRGWRPCTGSLEAMVDFDNRTDACTLVHAGLETFTSTTHTTTSMAFTLEARKVPNQAWAACHPFADNATGRHILVPTLEEAQEACLASPACNGLIDLNCDGFGYRLCEEVDGMYDFELDITYARRDVKEACIMRKHTTTVTTTTTTTTTHLADIFSDGPHMGNMAWRAGHCSQPYVVTNASSQREEAMRECERMGADCEGLHDIGCDGIGYRLCEIMNTTAMVEFEESTEACSIVKELDPCSCQYVWEFNGSTHGGCSETPDYNHTWCYVTGGERCANATASTVEEQSWRDCDAPCACLPEWEWLGVEYEGCSETFDWPGHHWCYINNGRRCPGAIESTAHPGSYWSEVCKGPCECKPHWDYLNHSYSNCSETPDWWGNTWCYVEGGSECASAEPSTTNVGMYWDDTCEGPCDCMESWDWLGKSYSGCAMTPDWENHDWCYVRDGPHCGSAVQSTANPNHWWSQTCSACIKPGHDVGGSYNECGYMPIYKILTTDPTYTIPGWCFACESVQVVDLRAIGTAAACQARCAEEEDCDYFYHTAEGAASTYCYLKRYYDAESVLNITNDASCDPLYQPAVGSAGPKKCDEGIFKSYDDGPNVTNKAASHCSEWYGSLGDAEYICNMNDDCTGLLDFACDGGDGWRWCTKSFEELAALGGDTMACTKVASASGAP